MLLEGKSIVVTGGNTGIGEAIVLADAAEGANAVVDYGMHPDYRAWVIAVAGRSGGCAVGVGADAARTEDLHRVIRTAVENFDLDDLHDAEDVDVSVIRLAPDLAHATPGTAALPRGLRPIWPCVVV
jgi:NAD(P)-dependent dehydrogenase (short-subunit alcohol dehydrogenase family)